MPRSRWLLLLICACQYASLLAVLADDSTTAAPSGAVTPEAQAWIAAAQDLRFADLEQHFASLQGSSWEETQVAAILYAAQQAYAVEKRELAERWLRMIEPHAVGRLQPAVADALVWCFVEPSNLSDASPRLLEMVELHNHSAFAPLVLWQRGRALELAERNEEAVWIYHELARRFPQSNSAARAMLHATRLHLDAEQHAEANEWGERLISQQATSEEAGSVHYLLGEAAWKRSETLEAGKHWQTLVEQFPQHPLWCDAAYRLALAWHGKATHASEAQALLARMLERPETSVLWRQRAGYLQGQIAIAAQDWKGAAQYLEKCVALEQQTAAKELDAALCCQVAYWQAEVEYQQLHWEAAEAKFARAAELVEGKMEAYWGVIAHRQALLAARRQAWREGLEHIDRLERTYHDYAQRDAVDYLHGRCLFGLAHVNEARDKWQQLIARTADKPSQWTAQSQWMMGESYLVQRKYEAALAAYDAAIALRDFPHWQAAALVQSAKCCDALARPADATARYERVVREFSHTPYYALAARQFGDETPRVAQQQETESGTQR